MLTPLLYFICMPKGLTSIIYLGGLISNDCPIIWELSRRIGMAQADLISLQRVLSYANNTRIQKIWICINQQRSRLDVFESRCLRRIFGIKHAFSSRVSIYSLTKVSYQTAYRRRTDKRKQI